MQIPKTLFKNKASDGRCYASLNPVKNKILKKDSTDEHNVDKQNVFMLGFFSEMQILQKQLLTVPSFKKKVELLEAV